VKKEKRKQDEMDLGLKGRVAIVAAASKGLGRAVALELAREGAEVAICARSASNLEQAVKAIREATGRTVYAEAVDVTDAARVAQFVAAVEKRFGRLDICVTNAGGPPAKSFLEATTEQWRSAFELTLMSTVHFAREALPRMKSRGWGRFVTITSNSVKQPIDGLLLSNSIRAGVTGLAKTLSNEFGPFGITVNNVCPGYTRTDRLAELAQARAGKTGESTEKIFEQWAALTPLKRVGTPEEFAAVVTFLVSEHASYVTGVSVAVDGGAVRGLF
jgi:3-oxoacyl-[acyl-carrier protein] reductase